MVYLERCGLLCQAMPDTILKCPDYPLYLPIGFAIANGDVVVDDAQPLAELCKTAHKLGATIYPELVWLGPAGNQIII